MGIRQEMTSHQYGDLQERVLYIKVLIYNRITFFGSIIHFVADVTTTTSNYNPYGYYNPYSPYGSYYSPYSSYYSPYSNYYSPYSYGGYPYSNNSTRTNLEMFIIDFETGKEYEYDLENLDHC
jgi:hypothetical protein